MMFLWMNIEEGITSMSQPFLPIVECVHLLFVMDYLLEDLLRSLIDQVDSNHLRYLLEKSILNHLSIDILLLLSHRIVMQDHCQSLFRNIDHSPTVVMKRIPIDSNR